ncbi:hypothetical protein GN244_ATG15951 [Phytophthora infestans]|uniref:Uncharacterized protein n=1 Tax=Phytophthora infestans TaxID=4787 RepID=A0A833W7W9_PHYIN|nr:hypothetical protein GN244_ATG15951 [Phytophthora infestans]
MAPSRTRPQLTQEDEDREARAHWDSLFVAADARERAISRVQIIPTIVDSPERVLKMCNFSPREFDQLWDVVEDHGLSKWNVGRGKKNPNSPKDVLFLTLAALKQCGSWDTVLGLKSHLGE